MNEANESQLSRLASLFQAPPPPPADYGSLQPPREAEEKKDEILQVSSIAQWRRQQELEQLVQYLEECGKRLPVLFDEKAGKLTTLQEKELVFRLTNGISGLSDKTYRHLIRQIRLSLDQFDRKKIYYDTSAQVEKKILACLQDNQKAKQPKKAAKKKTSPAQAAASSAPDVQLQNAPPSQAAASSAPDAGQQNVSSPQAAASSAPNTSESFEQKLSSELEQICAQYCAEFEKKQDVGVLFEWLKEANSSGNGKKPKKAVSRPSSQVMQAYADLQDAIKKQFKIQFDVLNAQDEQKELPHSTYFPKSNIEKILRKEGAYFGAGLNESNFHGLSLPADAVYALFLRNDVLCASPDDPKNSAVVSPSWESKLTQCKKEEIFVVLSDAEVASLMQRIEDNKASLEYVSGTQKQFLEHLKIHFTFEKVDHYLHQEFAKFNSSFDEEKMDDEEKNKKLFGDFFKQIASSVEIPEALQPLYNACIEAKKLVLFSEIEEMKTGSKLAKAVLKFFQQRFEKVYKDMWSRVKTRSNAIRAALFEKRPLASAPDWLMVKALQEEVDLLRKQALEKDHFFGDRIIFSTAFLPAKNLEELLEEWLRKDKSLICKSELCALFDMWMEGENSTQFDSENFFKVLCQNKVMRDCTPDLLDTNKMLRECVPEFSGFHKILREYAPEFPDLKVSCDPGTVFIYDEKACLKSSVRVKAHIHWNIMKVRLKNFSEGRGRTMHLTDFFLQDARDKTLLFHLLDIADQTKHQQDCPIHLVKQEDVLYIEYFSRYLAADQEGSRAKWIAEGVISKKGKVVDHAFSNCLAGKELTQQEKEKMAHFFPGLDEVALRKELERIFSLRPERVDLQEALTFSIEYIKSLLHAVKLQFFADRNVPLSLADQQEVQQKIGHYMQQIHALLYMRHHIETSPDMVWLSCNLAQIFLSRVDALVSTMPADAAYPKEELLYLRKAVVSFKEAIRDKSAAVQQTASVEDYFLHMLANPYAFYQSEDMGLDASVNVQIEMAFRVVYMRHWLEESVMPKYQQAFASFKPPQTSEDSQAQAPQVSVDTCQLTVWKGMIKQSNVLKHERILLWVREELDALFASHPGVQGRLHKLLSEGEELDENMKLLRTFFTALQGIKESLQLEQWKQEAEAQAKNPASAQQGNVGKKRTVHAEAFASEPLARAASNPASDASERGAENMRDTQWDFSNLSLRCRGISDPPPSPVAVLAGGKFSGVFARALHDRPVNMPSIARAGR